MHSNNVVVRLYTGNRRLNSLIKTANKAEATFCKVLCKGTILPWALLFQDDLLLLTENQRGQRKLTASGTTSTVPDPPR
jgi:hypothetical protein